MKQAWRSERDSHTRRNAVIALLPHVLLLLLLLLLLLPV